MMIWILVANQSEARVYSADRIHGGLTLGRTFTHPAGAAHVRDLITDAPGRGYDRTGPARHSMEPDTGVKEEERRRFVKEVVEWLSGAHLQGKFDRLVLLAAPAVLGVLRKTLSGGLQQAVVKEIPKDVIGQSEDKIQAQLVRSFALK
jgi:protein required for attachment to host cells